MALRIERVVDGAAGGDEALSVALGFEPLRFSLSSPDRKVRILDPVIVAQSAGLVAMLAF